MLTATQIEEIRDKIKPHTATNEAPKDTRLILMAQEPSNHYHWTRYVVSQSPAEWLEILDLAAMAARIRER